MEFLPGVSVIVNTLNDEADVGKMLQSIVACRPQQIVVVDGGSSDRTREIAQQYSSEVYQVPPSIFHQHKFALSKIKHEFMVVAECDHRYPANFLELLKSEFVQSGYFGLQATLVCIDDSNFFERGMKAFYEIHQSEKGVKPIISGPGIYRSEEYIRHFDFEPVEGFGVDTMRAEILQNRRLVVGLGHTVAYQKQSLSCKACIRKFTNYGAGDYNFYTTNAKNWTLARKWKSVTHVFCQYFVRYPKKAIEMKLGYGAVLFLYFSGTLRYLGWFKKLL